MPTTTPLPSFWVAVPNRGAVARLGVVLDEEAVDTWHAKTRLEDDCRGELVLVPGSVVVDRIL